MLFGTKKNEEQASAQASFTPSSHIKYVVIAIVAILLIGAFIMAIFIIKDSLGRKNIEEKKAEEKTTLPPNLMTNKDEIDRGENNPKKAEEMLFGDFYQKPAFDFEVKKDDYELPVNIKKDSLNYYDVSRKINLDPALDNLNNYGFSELKNPFQKNNNFYGAYAELIAKNLPILITSDFLLYYYQNNLKQIYKKIEKNVFYGNIWDIEKRLFDVSDSRYKYLLNKYGTVNDPILEAGRSVSAYHAVAIELLKPLKPQISMQKDESKYTQEEAEFFTFSFPGHLKDDVEKEVELIRAANGTAKSPVLRYQVDYSAYRVPDNYKRDAKLSNFYLASRWLNSVFPLYYAGEECQQCLLDKEDWTVNFIAASMLAKDIADEQQIKNQWAKIYKVISFFNGLKNELTYLNYQDAQRSLFGEDFAIEKIFSQENSNRDKNLIELQQKIAQYGFSELESGIDRANKENLPRLGLRILQESYWPDEYMLQKLIYPNVTTFMGERVNNELNKTNCKQEKTKIIMRCMSSALDMANLIHPLREKHEYFRENSNYEHYEEISAGLKSLLDNFNDNTWHSNIFWTTLNLGKYILNNAANSMPAFAKNDNWERKGVSSITAAWVSTKFPDDILIPYVGSADEKGLAANQSCNPHNYIEPNYLLAAEIRANIKMLYDILEGLGMHRNNETVKNDLNGLNLSLENAEKIIKKELSGENLEAADACTIQNLAGEFQVQKEASRETKFYFNFSGRRLIMYEDLRGVKLAVVLYENKGDLVLAIGPIFNFFESR